MRDHITILGWLYLIWSGFHVVGGLLAFLGFTLLGGAAAAAGGREGLMALPILGSIGAVVFLIIGVIFLPGIAAGWGLLNRASWARVLGIILSVLNLIHFPLGTIVGIYGLFVLLNSETAAIFDRRAAY